MKRTTADKNSNLILCPYCRQDFYLDNLDASDNSEDIELKSFLCPQCLKTVYVVKKLSAVHKATMVFLFISALLVPIVCSIFFEDLSEDSIKTTLIIFIVVVFSATLKFFPPQTTLQTTPFSIKNIAVPLLWVLLSLGLGVWMVIAFLDMRRGFDAFHYVSKCFREDMTTPPNPVCFYLAKGLIASGMDVNEPGGRGYIPLAEAIRNKNNPIFDLLLKAGADLTKPSSGGLTPLHVAARYGTAYMVNTLLLKGIDPNIRDLGGRTPLHYSCLNKSEIEITKVLIAHSAEVDAKSNSGQTPLMWAARAGSTSCAKLLVNNGANIYERD